MYSTCVFCTRPLGVNEVVETFPVGRRLAFDAAKGRLWVVCRRCERWNLTPLEERWEAVEACEEIFRGTRVRTSSENIGLARHPEGLELVRIGKPLRPEFAAWRYGDQFGKRRRRRIVRWTAAGAAALAGGALGGAMVGIAGVLGAVYAITVVPVLKDKPIRFKPADGRIRQMSIGHVWRTRIRSADDETGFRVQIDSWGIKGREWLEGEDAHRAIRVILPRMNAYGGSATTVEKAVSEIESEGHPHGFLSRVVDRPRTYAGGLQGQIHPMRKPARLALEMALHEEQERRALEGELWRLERAWEEAEEIAAIADNLLLPKRVTGFLSRHARAGSER